MKTKLLIVVFAKTMLSFGSFSYAQSTTPLSANEKVASTNLIAASGNVEIGGDDGRAAFCEPVVYESLPLDANDLHVRIVERMRYFTECGRSEQTNVLYPQPESFEMNVELAGRSIQ